MLISGGSIYVGDSAITKVYQGEDLVWPTTPTPSEPDWLTFTVVSGGTIYFENHGEGQYQDVNFYAELEYNKNGTGWKTISSSGYPISFAVSAGDVVKLRCNGHRKVYDYNYSVFYEEYDDGEGYSYKIWNNFQGSTARFNISGSLLSMEYGSGFTGQTQTEFTYDGFKYLFKDTLAADASGLILPEFRQYYGPSLDGLFYNCSTLVSAPVFGINNKPYDYMFYNCRSLNYIKCLYPTPGVYTDWLRGVTPSGTFVKAAGANWHKGADGIPEGWIIINE